MNSNHKRVLSTTVRIADEKIREIKRVLSDKNDSGISPVETSYGAEDKEKILSLLDEAGNLNKRFFLNFDLQRETLTEKQIVYSRISQLIAILVDSRSKKLNSFGSLNSETGKEIDMRIDEIISKLEKILNL